MNKIKVYLIFLFDFLIRFIPFKSPQKYNVAIVRSDAIGDFILFVSALQAIRNKMEGKKILLVCPSQNRPLVEKLQLIDDVLFFDKKKMESSLLYHIGIIFKLKRIHASLVVNPTIAHHLTDDLIVSVIKAEQRIGTKVEKKGFLNKLCDSFYTKLIDVQYKDSHEIKALERFIQKAIDNNFRYKLSDLRKIYDNFLPNIKLPYCIIALSSSVKGKIWPKEKLIQVINEIPDSYSIVLTGYGNDDLETCKYIINNANSPKQIVNYVNKTTLDELVCIISKANLVLGNDSASVHIASACRVPSICYVPGAHYGKFLPYPKDLPEPIFHPICVCHDMGCNGCNYHCKYVNPMEQVMPCLNGIEPEEVIKEMKKIL